MFVLQCRCVTLSTGTMFREELMNASAMQLMIILPTVRIAATSTHHRHNV